MAKQILIVENTDSDRELLKIILSTHGYAVEESSSARQALDVLGRKKPDLVVLDSDLPDENGWTLCERFKHQLDCGTMPVLMLSARCPQQAQLDGSCADDLLLKPFDDEKLLAKIHHLLAA